MKRSTRQPVGRPTVLLLSSNLRRRYTEDILSALALPSGARIQFRYGRDHVAPALQQRIANKDALHARALLAFVADMYTDLPFLVPVRFASVAQAESVADMFIFQLRVEAYANLDNFPFSEPDVRQQSKQRLDGLIQLNGRYYPAVGQFPDFKVEDVGDPAHMWLGVVQRLTKHPTFRSSYFLRIDTPRRQSGKMLSFDGDGRLVLTGEQSAKLPVGLYGAEYSDEGRKSLSCLTDGTFVRVSSDESYDIALRYDSVEFWLQPGTTSFDALARVTLQLQQDSASTETTPAPSARFQVLVKRSRTWLAARVGTSGIGALLVALPAILGEGTSLRLRISLAVGGAILLAYSTVVMSRAGASR